MTDLRRLLGKVAPKEKLINACKKACQNSFNDSMIKYELTPNSLYIKSKQKGVSKRFFDVVKKFGNENNIGTFKNLGSATINTGTNSFVQIKVRYSAGQITECTVTWN